VVTAALAVIAVPLIAFRTVPRADMFSVLMFAGFLSILWEQYEAATGKLWLLPGLMVAWVNLHLGFIAGLALVGAYVVLEAVRVCGTDQRQAAIERLKRVLPFAAATVLATFANPWGWNIYRALSRQQAAMVVHAESITEWAGITLTGQTLKQAFAVHDPASSAVWLMLLAAIAVIMALLHRSWPAAVLLSCALWVGIRHTRFLTLMACIVVIVGGTILSSVLHAARTRIGDKRLVSMLGYGAMAALILLASVRSVDLVTNRYYFGTNHDSANFGTGLSWWFPERATAFIEREKLPPQIFNGYEMGGFLLWSLGPNYRDYADGRAIPFGPALFTHLQQLLQSPPDSPVWQREADSYGINTVMFSLARHDGLRFVGLILRPYCDNESWRPVYLDEISAVFVRRTPETEALIERTNINCSTAQLSATTDSHNRVVEFNRLANSASLLSALQRYPEATAASTQALSIFSDSASLWYLRGRSELVMGYPSEAERDLLRSAALEDNLVTLAELADLYGRQNRLPAAVTILERMVAISPDPSEILMVLGHTQLDAGRPKDALQTFDHAIKILPAEAGNLTLADAYNCKALAWNVLGDIGRATGSEENAVYIAPQVTSYRDQLSRLYDLQGRVKESKKALEPSWVPAGGNQPSH
jgi:tetratricopeptide (TPR) repeat protein